MNKPAEPLPSSISSHPKWSSISVYPGPSPVSPLSGLSKYLWEVKTPHWVSNRQMILRSGSIDLQTLTLEMIPVDKIFMAFSVFAKGWKDVCMWRKSGRWHAKIKIVAMSAERIVWSYLLTIFCLQWCYTDFSATFFFFKKKVLNLHLHVPMTKVKSIEGSVLAASRQFLPRQGFILENTWVRSI